MPVVRDIWHEPLDPSRPLAARGADLETEEEIYAQNPQLLSVLTTRFTATVTGYVDGLDISRDCLQCRQTSTRLFSCAMMPRWRLLFVNCSSCDC